MGTHYLTATLRTLRTHTGYAVINVIGLAVGIACFTVILLFVRDELSYDRFHPHADRLFRVDTQANVSDPPTHSTGSAYVLSDALTASFPEIEQTAHLGTAGTVLISRDDRNGYETGLSFASPSVVDLFQVSFVRGDARTALAEPNAVVLTETLAARYFGSADPLGQSVVVERQNETLELTVTGIIEALPANTHLAFEGLISEATLRATGPPPLFTSWTWLNTVTYLRLRPGAEWHALNAKLPDFLERHVAQAEPGRRLWYQHYLQPVTDIHLNRLGLPIASTGDERYVVLFSLVALLVLLIAVVNYMNLTTARAVTRAREVGVRKALGARRSQLSLQFLTEATLLSLGAFLLALVLIAAALPAFTALTGTSFTVHAWYDPALCAVVLATSLIAGGLAGSYPALVLSRFQPLRVLRGSYVSGPSGRRLRTSLVVGQFTVSIVLLIGTVVVFQQLDYMRSARLGFDRSRVVALPLRSNDVRDRAEALKDAIGALSDVRAVSIASYLPGTGADGHGVKKAGADAYSSLSVLAVDPAYRDVMNLRVTEGRWFDAAFGSDSSAYVLNEAAAAHFGGRDILGQSLDRNGMVGPVIGVVEDFPHASLHDEIRPLVLYVGSDWWDRRYLAIKLNPGNGTEALAALRRTWERVVPDRPFDYQFLDDTLDRLYTAEQRLGSLFGAFALIGLLVACLGLFGLSAFMASQRTKEIGIRKVLGATATQLASRMTWDFARLVALAFLFGAPVAYLAMDRWLADYAYRIELSGWLFLGVGLTALGVAVLTVSYQSIRAALADPVQSLRYE